MKTIRLSRLRDIGWKEWDPIGLLGLDESWQDNQRFADEYDTYLMQAAARLRRGVPDVEVVEYLIEIEQNHMGLEMNTDTKKRAERVVRCITGDKDLWNEDGSPLGVA